MPLITYTPQQLQEGALINMNMGNGKLQAFSTFNHFPPNFNHSQSLSQYFTFETKTNSYGNYDGMVENAKGSWYQHGSSRNIIKFTNGTFGIIGTYVNSIIVTREVGTTSGDQWRFVPTNYVVKNTVLIRGTGEVGLTITTQV